MPGNLRYGVEVRAAQPSDAPELARLLSACGIPVSARTMADRLEAVRAHAAASVLVATGYPGLSGLVAIAWTPMLHELRAAARITLLMVDPEERRRGIGRLLLKAASQAARTAGCDSIELAVTPEQVSAEAFCRNTGFAPQGAVYGRLLRKKA